MVSFHQKIIFLFLLNVDHIMPEWFVMYQEARIFFLLKKKLFLKQNNYLLRFS